MPVIDSQPIVYNAN